MPVDLFHNRARICCHQPVYATPHQYPCAAQPVASGNTKNMVADLHNHGMGNRRLEALLASRHGAAGDAAAMGLSLSTVNPAQMAQDRGGIKGQAGCRRL
jgi:hypothetical protein